MTIQRRVAFPERKLPTPDWVQSPEQIRQTVLTYVERRLQLRTGYGESTSRTIPVDWTVAQRLEHIEIASKIRIEEQTGILARLINLHQEWERDGVPKVMVARLERVIQNWDGDLSFVQRGPVSLALSIAYQFHRCGDNSVQVAEKLKLKPTHIRQVLLKLERANREVLGILKPSRA